MIKRSTLAIIAIAAAVPTATMAQDNRDSHFDGPYVSVAGGMAAFNNDQGETVEFDTNRDGKYGDTVATTTGANAFSPGFCHGTSGGATPAAGCSGDENHWEYAARIGYDYRVGHNLVGGLLIEGSRANSRNRVTAFSTTPARYTLGRKIDYAVAVRGRLGFTPGGGALFYVTGGPALAKMDHSFSTTNTLNTFTENGDNKWRLGGQVGGGSEVMITDNISLGLEYLYNGYRDGKYDVGVTQGTAPSTNPFILRSAGTNMRSSDTRYDFHSLRASLSYQF